MNGFHLLAWIAIYVMALWLYTTPASIREGEDS